MLGLASSLVKGGASLLTYVKDNLKLYLDFKSSRSDTLAFPSEGSTSFTNTTGEHINCGTQIATDLGGSFNTAFTVSFWLYRTVTNNSCGMFYIGTFDNINGKIQIYTHLDTLKFRINNVDQLDIDNFSANNAGWNHITLTWNASTTTSTVYVNGVAQTPKTNSESSIAFTSSMKTIIGNYFGEVFPLSGKMANVALWSRALSLEEVNSVMNKSYSQLGSVEKTSLVSWWALDSASGGVVQPHDGETLGSNIASSLTWVNSSSSPYETFVTSGNSITNAVNTSWGIAYTSDFSLTSAKSYKISFDIDISSGSIDLVRIGGNTNLDSGLQLDKVPANGINTFYITSSATGSSFKFGFRGNDAVAFSMSNLSIKEVTSNTGFVTGATTTTSVYGGNAPVLPRAIDIAESQAEQIGDGSASFNGSTDYVEIDSSNLPNLQPYTISAWFKIDTLQASAIIAWGDEAVYERRSMFIWNGGSGSSWKLIPSIYGENPTGATDLETNRWYHGALVVNPTAKTYEIYLNGILDGSGSYSNNFVSWSGTTGYIGKTGSGEDFDGAISQVGLWQGALTSEQVRTLAQDVTSYAKIPADVKSTLGAEVNTLANALSPSNEANATTGLTSTGSISSVSSPTYSGNYSIKFETDANTEYISASSNFTVEDDKFYKFSVTWKTDSSSHSMKHFIGTGIGSTAYVNIEGVAGSTEWVTSDYYFITTSTNLNFTFAEFTGDSDIVMYIDNISIKPVTNDLVAYYPLDADSSNTSNGVGITNDSVGGETLGSDLVTNGDMSNLADAGSNGYAFRPSSGWTFKHSSSSGGTSTQFSQSDNGALRIYSNRDGIEYYTVGANVLVSTGVLYKLTFDAKTNDASKTNLGVRYSNGNNMAYGNNGLDVGVTLTTSFQTFTYYFVPDAHSNGGRAVHFGRHHNTSVGHTTSVDATLDNVSVKQVTSNTGVLK